MNKKHAYEIMKELKQHCEENDCLNCVFSNNTGCELINKSPNYYNIDYGVTFEEVLKSDEKCIVEHEYINEIDYKKIERKLSILMYKSDKNIFLEKLNKIKNNNFMYFDDVMAILSWVLIESKLKEVIKNGKWYLEE